MAVTINVNNGQSRHYVASEIQRLSLIRGNPVISGKSPHSICSLSVCPALQVLCADSVPMPVPRGRIQGLIRRVDSERGNSHFKFNFAIETEVIPPNPSLRSVYLSRFYCTDGANSFSLYVSNILSESQAARSGGRPDTG